MIKLNSNWIATFDLGLGFIWTTLLNGLSHVRLSMAFESKLPTRGAFDSWDQLQSISENKGFFAVGYLALVIIVATIFFI